MRYDVIIIGGGLAGITAGICLQKAGKRTLCVAAGLTLRQSPRAEYVAAGGTILPGDIVCRAVVENDKVLSVGTKNLGKTELVADNFILCTGKFFSKGLVSTMDSIVEPVFNCDVDYDHDTSKWVSDDFFAPQPFMSFGVVTDADGHVCIGGKTITNLYAAGEILAGDVDIEKSALDVCRKII